MLFLLTMPHSGRLPRLLVLLAPLRVLAGFIGLATLFYLPLVFGLATFPDGDFTHHFLPFALFERQELLAGRLPLWNPYTYSGHPFLADIQAALFYPLGALLMGLSLPFGAVGERLYLLQLEALLHVALAGWFTYLLVKTLTGSRWAGWVAGVTFAFSGYLTGYPPLQLAILRSAIWLPLLLLCLLRGLQPPFAWRWWIGGALVYATAFLAGHPQTFLHISYFAAAFVAWQIGRGWRTMAATPSSGRVPWWGQLALRLLLFGGLSAGLTAVQWLPSVEFTRLSVRADTSYAFVSGGFPLQDSWQLLLPGVLTQFSPLYVGVIGVGLALMAVVAWLARWGKPHLDRLAQVPFFAGMGLLALLLSLGGNGFLYPLFFRFAPGWNLFRGQERVAFLVALCLSVLAGYGASILESLLLRRRRWIAVAYLLLVGVGVIGFALFWQRRGRSVLSAEAYWALGAFLLLCALALGISLWRAGWSQRRQWLVFVGILVSLFVPNLPTNLDQFSPARKTILAPEMEALATAVGDSVASGQGTGERVYNEFRIYEDYGMRQQIEDVWGSSPLRLARYAQLFEDFPVERMWRLLGVGHVLSWRNQLPVAAELLQAFPQATDTTYLYRLQGAAPHLWLVHSWQVQADALTVAALKNPSFDLENTGLLSVDVKVDSGDSVSGLTTVSSQSLAPNRQQIHVQSEGGGLLIVSENWMPGWKVVNVRCLSPAADCATLSSPVGGVAAFSVLRANLTLIGIPIPSGSFQFELQYDPPTVKWGIGISIVTLSWLGLVLLWRILPHLR